MVAQWSRSIHFPRNVTPLCAPQATPKCARHQGMFCCPPGHASPSLRLQIPQYNPITTKMRNIGRCNTQCRPNTTTPCCRMHPLVRSTSILKRHTHCSGTFVLILLPGTSGTYWNPLESPLALQSVTISL
ncbi:hypothetical protein BD289DRAFT_95448 [Coniella lustricola]|uniref:Uncharacterized protein n=1 Tax=Coniella lustricola TaxID=2025994 RepID=A0A2T2ZY44_9PEZI|nr:hypothetical protein BD289DRAFT_95448 [Coniella lustricola]